MKSQINPELSFNTLKDYSVIGAYHLETVIRAGVKEGREFEEFSKGVIGDLGEEVKPYLKEIWNNLLKDEELIKEIPEIARLKEIRETQGNDEENDEPGEGAGQKSFKQNERAFLKSDRARKILIIIFIFFSVLILTNPTNTEFNHYLRGQGYRNAGGRIHNYFIFSVFGYYSGRYIGVMGNFIEIEKPTRVGRQSIKQRVDF